MAIASSVTTTLGRCGLPASSPRATAPTSKGKQSSRISYFPMRMKWYIIAHLAARCHSYARWDWGDSFTARVHPGLLVGRASGFLGLGANSGMNRRIDQPRTKRCLAAADHPRCGDRLQPILVIPHWAGWADASRIKARDAKCHAGRLEVLAFR